MVDLSVEIGGVVLKNPVALASGAPGWNGEGLKKCAEAGAGAVVPKSIGPPEEWLHHPRNGRMKYVEMDGKKIGMINLELFSTRPFEDWITEELKIAAEGGSPIIASVVADPDPENTRETAGKVADTGYPSMIEINVSCPMPKKAVGIHIGRSTKKVKEQVEAVKESVTIPVGVKLSPNFAYEDELARAVEDSGGDFITATNSVQGLHSVDIETGKLRLRAFGGYSGPAVKPIMLRCVAKIAKEVDIPIFGVGGVSNWNDVVEYLMIGAEAVQICTAAIWKGPEIFGEITDGLSSFMKKKGYDTLEDFRGVALQDLTTVEELARGGQMYAMIDQNSCIGCEDCTTVCQYGAIEISNGTAESDPALCDGCGLCSEVCPEGAVELLRKIEEV